MYSQPANHVAQQAAPDLQCVAQARAQASKQKAAGAQPAAAAAAVPAASLNGNEAFRVSAASQPELTVWSSVSPSLDHHQHVSQPNGSWQNGYGDGNHPPAQPAAGPTQPTWRGSGEDAEGVEASAGEGYCFPANLAGQLANAVVKLDLSSYCLPNFPDVLMDARAALL